MRQIVQDQAAPPSLLRWHQSCEEPVTGEAIEVDVGDFRVWRGVRFAVEIEAFIDEDTGAFVPVMMWRYAGRH